MCVPVGLTFGCLSRDGWRGWVQCGSIFCPLRLRAINTLPPDPKRKDIKDDVFKKYQKLVNAYRLFLTIVPCCGPSCCGEYIGSPTLLRSRHTELERFNKVKTHFETCMPFFNKHLGRLNCMRLALGDITSVSMPPDTSPLKKLVLNLEKHLPTSGMEGYKDLCRQGQGLQASTYDEIQQYVAIRAEVLAHTNTLTMESNRPNSYLRDEFESWQGSKDSYPDRAALAGLEKVFERIVECVAAFADEWFTPRPGGPLTPQMAHSAIRPIGPAAQHDPQAVLNLLAGTPIKTPPSSGGNSTSSADIQGDFVTIVHALKDLTLQASRFSDLPKVTDPAAFGDVVAMLHNVNLTVRARQAELKPLSQELERLKVKVRKQQWDAYALSKLMVQLQATSKAIDRKSAPGKGQTATTVSSEALVGNEYLAYLESLRVDQQDSPNDSPGELPKSLLKRCQDISIAIGDLPELPTLGTHSAEGPEVFKLHHEALVSFKADLQQVIDADWTSLSDIESAELSKSIQKILDRIKQAQRDCIELFKEAKRRQVGDSSTRISTNAPASRGGGGTPSPALPSRGGLESSGQNRSHGRHAPPGRSHGALTASPRTSSPLSQAGNTMTAPKPPSTGGRGNGGGRGLPRGRGRGTDRGGRGGHTWTS